MPAKRLPLQYLSDEELAAIEETSYRLLNEVGISLQHAGATEMLRGLGCRVENGRVFIPPDVVRWGIEHVTPQKDSVQPRRQVRRAAGRRRHPLPQRRRSAVHLQSRDRRARPCDLAGSRDDDPPARRAAERRRDHLALLAAGGAGRADGRGLHVRHAAQHPQAGRRRGRREPAGCPRHHRDGGGLRRRGGSPPPAAVPDPGRFARSAR